MTTKTRERVAQLVCSHEWKRYELSEKTWRSCRNCRAREVLDEPATGETTYSPPSLEMEGGE